MADPNPISAVLHDDLRDALRRRCVALDIVRIVGNPDGDDYARVEVSARDCNDGLFTCQRTLPSATFTSYDLRQAWIAGVTAKIVDRWRQPMDEAAFTAWAKG